MAKKTLQRKKPGYTKGGEVKIVSLSYKQLTEMLEKASKKTTETITVEINGGINAQNSSDTLNGITNLYSFIDEGVFTGEYTKKFGTSELVSDDKNTFIQASGINTQGTFSYKCKVNKPILRPDLSSFRVRATAPLYNNQTATTPYYLITDIKFEDPSGNLIIEYE